ncbi:MAG: ABC transporter permease [Rhizobiales bacterium]|nr:ABC transporter permease [Hyphomicrobiales bacterium]
MRGPQRMSGGPMPVTETPIVPRDSIGGRALVAVVAIMTFLASLTTGAVMLIYAAAGEWQADVAREVTIQVRPVSGRDIDVEVENAVNVARAFAGISEVRPFTREESARLLEPWLGSGLALEDLPVPRVIVVKIAPGAVPNLAQLQKTLTERVTGAALDDHRGWIERMRTMAGTAVIGGAIVLILMLVATVLSVTFATRGAMAANRPIVEVLHFIGARDAFIADQFQRHFLVLGLKGGAIGGGLAILLFVSAGFITNWFLGTAGADQVAALFGSFSIGVWGYSAIVLQVVLIAVVTAMTSRRTVNQTLKTV